MNHLCVLSTYNRLRHVQENQFTVSVIELEALSSYCLMKYTSSKAHTFSIRGNSWSKEMKRNFSLIRKLHLHKHWSHCDVYSVACSEMIAEKEDKKKTSQQQDVQRV